MSKMPLQYVLYEREAVLGKLKGKTVIQAQPTGRKRLNHRDFCDEVGRDESEWTEGVKLLKC